MKKTAPDYIDLARLGGAQGLINALWERARGAALVELRGSSYLHEPDLQELASEIATEAVESAAWITTDY